MRFGIWSRDASSRLAIRKYVDTVIRKHVDTAVQPTPRLVCLVGTIQQLPYDVLPSGVRSKMPEDAVKMMPEPLAR